MKQGDVAAVLGVGGLGHLAVQFISKLGNDVYGVTTSVDKKDFILSLGAKDIVNSKDPEDLKKNKGKFDLIIDTIPSIDNFQSRFDLLAKGGTYVLVGVGDASNNNLEISSHSLVIGEKKLVGSLVGSRENIVEMLQLCKEKDIYPMVEEFNFEEFPKALDRLENGKPVFRCVVNCEEFSKKNNLFK
jgi:uncharacterized zinc-type alcohol dehydrogenase-like protein